jgi:type IV secretion system protein VirD4
LQAAFTRAEPAQAQYSPKQGRKGEREGTGMGALTTKNLKRHFLTTSLAISRIDSFFSHTKQLHNARFALLHELESLLTPSIDAIGTSLLLGVNHLGHILRVSPTKKRRELGNVLVVAPTRGGKGLLAVSQLLTWPHSVIVNDIKGDLFTQTAGYRQSLGPVFVIDPTGVGHRYDPLYGKNTEEELLSLATHLLFQAQDKETIYTERAIFMLLAIFQAARKKEVAPLPYTRFLVNELGLAGTANHLHTISPLLSTRFLDTELEKADLTDRFLLSCWGTLCARIRSLLTETAIRSISGSDFTAEELMTSQKPMTVYLRLRERDLKAQTPLVRLLFGSFIDELITTNDERGGEGCNPVLILADEAGRTPIPSLSESATTVVGRRISLWIAVQDLKQLENAYGQARADTLRNNMDSQIYYRQQEYKTAAHIEQTLGRRSGFAHSETTREGGNPTQGLSEQAVSVIAAQDIMCMTDEDIIGRHRHLRPFRGKRMDWQKHPLLRRRRSIKPPTLPKLPPLPDLDLRETNMKDNVASNDNLTFKAQEDTGDYELTNPDEIGRVPPPSVREGVIFTAPVRQARS